jgi:DNA-binding NtrC family response regulator
LGVRILIVEHSAEVARVWSAFLAGQGLDCAVAATAGEAYRALRARPFDALVLDMELPEGEAIAVADFATYRNPEMPIIAVTARGFFSDSAIFELVPNARGVLQEPFRPEDMAALIEHYGGRYVSARRKVASGG